MTIKRETKTLSQGALKIAENIMGKTCILKLIWYKIQQTKLYRWRVLKNW